MSGLRVVQSGVHSLIQDEGRFGSHHIGLTVGGPLDRHSFRWANKLCSNPINTPVIEVTIGGLVLESTVDTYFAVTGALVDLSINKVPVDCWAVNRIKSGDRIELGYAKIGIRCYLAVAGGFDIETTFGSCSTVTRESVGGLAGDGSPLSNGDLIPCGETLVHPPFFSPVQAQPHHLTTAPESTRLRVLLGYQQDCFTEQQKKQFFHGQYRISERNDRMGFRLLGPEIKPSIGGILSEGICQGAIQVPPDGQPIVLLNDRQTIGGYPKIGSVLSLDLDKLAQLGPESIVYFEEISIEQAHNLRHLAEIKFQYSEASIDLPSLSTEIEALLVASNPRGMKTVSSAIDSGSYLRAAQLINQAHGTILIGTGFPVNGSFETDGPVGAIALYRAIEAIGGAPVLVCEAPLCTLLSTDFNTHEIKIGEDGGKQAQEAISEHQPALIISIERPGQSSDGRYYNMRGIDISEHCADYDSFISLSVCPTIAIGDGGNEIGMGNIAEALEQLDIRAASTGCDELLLADISNWAAHGLVALLSVISNQDMLADWDNKAVLQMLSEGGSVDGVTGENTLTEDGVHSDVSQKLVGTLRKLSGF
ncbi:MAG: 5-oxoprolinase/urea amidolyase family protein [Porticoccaceae bacterium]|nr:5-oxoprolinase/urea amidolyase family protein [Porticoccaceae bacterium]|tara:strand:- start:2696 stop:4468 length:1773 start_codon:yes stop_codon:yes gene_type:complete